MGIIREEKRSDNTNTAIELMRNNMQYADEPEVGIFWYNPDTNDLPIVVSTLAADAGWYKSSVFGAEVRTDSRLHKDVWKKKKRNSDYTLYPRGRVFEFKNSGFKIYAGEWVYDYPDAINVIIDEFNLPKNTEVVIDKHWNIGHGWSDELM